MTGRESAAPSAARPLLSLLLAALCAAGVVALADLAVGTASGQRLDQLVLSGAKAHEGPLSQYAQEAVDTVSVPVIAALLALAVVLVLLRRRLALLLPLSALVLGANLTTQVVKHLVVDRQVLGPGIDITPNSFPSGHTTMAAAAMIAVVLAAGRGRVVLAPIGAAWTIAAGLGTLVAGWHRPSDVVGAILVVAAWTFLILALDGLHTRARLRRAAEGPGHGRRRRGPEGGTRSGHGPATRILAVLLGLAGLVGLGIGAWSLATLELPLVLEDTGRQLQAFTGAAGLIAGGTAAWMALVLVLRPPISQRAASH